MQNKLLKIMKNKVVSIIDVTLNVPKQLQKSQVGFVKISNRFVTDGTYTVITLYLNFQHHQIPGFTREDLFLTITDS